MTTDKSDGGAVKMKCMVFVVVKTIEVIVDEGKLDAEFWNEFNSSITDRGGPDVEYIGQHIAWNFVQGAEGFVEGVGDLAAMNIRVREVDSFVEPADATARDAQ